MPAATESPTWLDDIKRQREAWRRLPGRLFAALCTLDVVFVLLYVGAVAIHLGHSRYFVLFNLDAEANPPSWYSGIQLFIVAIGFLMLASQLVPHKPRVSVLRPLWIALGVGFTLLSMDEVGSIHERLSRLLYRMRVFNHFRFGDQWMWLYIAFAAVLVLIYRSQLVLAWREWHSETLLFVLGFAVLAFGAFFLEAARLRFPHVFRGSRIYVEVALEEGFEMVGASILALSAFRILSYVMTVPYPDEEVAASALEEAGGLDA